VNNIDAEFLQELP
jgi:hypothetical protein